MTCIYWLIRKLLTLIGRMLQRALILTKPLDLASEVSLLHLQTFTASAG